MEGNPIVAAVMLCTMVCMAIWPLFLLGLVAAGVLAYLHQWIAAGLLGVPSLWIVGLVVWFHLPGRSYECRGKAPGECRSSCQDWNRLR